MEKMKNRRKLNNVGMSLVEVLVAIAILAVVAGPLLKTFVSAMRYNSKARAWQNMTTAAQSIMEGFKAYDVEELCEQFGGLDTFKVVANADSFYEIPLSDRNGDGIADTSIIPVTDADGNTNPEFVAAADNLYAFALTGVNYEENVYDARVELSPFVTSEIAVVNETVVIVPFDADTDAQYDQDSSQDSVALMAIKEYAKTNDYTLANSADWATWYGMDAATIESTVDSIIEDCLHLTKKTVVVKVGSEWSGTYGGNINTVRVYAAYEYKMDAFSKEAGPDAWGNMQYITGTAKGPFTVYLKEDGTVTNSEYDAAKEMIYPTASTTDATKLEDIQICYYPAYDYTVYGVTQNVGLGNVSFPEEYISISNSLSKSINISLIKQKNTTLSEAQLFTMENVYNPMITANVSVSETTPGSIVRTDNFSVNLGDSTAGGSLLSTQTEVLMYDVKITLYESGAAADGFSAAWEPVLEFAGTMND